MRAFAAGIVTQKSVRSIYHDFNSAFQINLDYWCIILVRLTETAKLLEGHKMYVLRLLQYWLFAAKLKLKEPLWLWTFTASIVLL